MLGGAKFYMVRKSFIVHIDTLDVIDSLSNDDVANIFRAIKNYHNGEAINLTGPVAAIFTLFKNQFERDANKYEKTCEKNRENVLKRWDKNNTTVNDRKRPNTKHTDSDSKNDSDNESKKLDFSLFWNIYPRKEKKKDAQIKWDKLPIETQNTIIKTLPTFLKGKEKKYVPMPLSYFNAQRWEDELGEISTELERPREEDFPDWFAYDIALKAYSKQESDKFVSQL